MAGLNSRAGLPTVTGSSWPGVNYFCTLRSGGVSTGPYAELNLATHAGDQPEHVELNRGRLLACLPAAPLWLEQVHGVAVFDADQWPAAHGTLPVADASITTQANRVLAVMTADCLPVVIADRTGHALGLAHAGWRGLVAGVLENTLARLQQRLPGTVGWRAWIGPGISQPHFEVGSEVYAAFTAHGAACEPYFRPSERKGHWYADLRGLARHRLELAGVAEVESAAWCTYAQKELFYSYRREPVCGRMATVAWLSRPEASE